MVLIRVGTHWDLAFKVGNEELYGHMAVYSSFSTQQSSFVCTKFIIFNTQIIIYYTKFIIFNAKFISFHTRFITPLCLARFCRRNPS